MNQQVQHERETATREIVRRLAVIGSLPGPTLAERMLDWFPAMTPQEIWDTITDMEADGTLIRSPFNLGSVEVPNEVVKRFFPDTILSAPEAYAKLKEGQKGSKNE